MDAHKIFVGRKAELEQFKKVLKDPKGQAVLVVGQKGMGKTWLVNEVAERMEKKSALKCFSLRYQVTPTDPANTVMNDIMNDAADAIDSVRNKARKYVERNKQKLAALFGAGGLIPIVGSKVKAIGDLVISLTERDKTGNVRKQLIDVLKRLSDSLPDEGRVVFIIDPEKYMEEKSDYAWGLVVDKLPSKIKFVFPQRPEDVLVTSDEFCLMKNVRRVPSDELDVLDDEAIDDLVDKYSKRTKYSTNELHDAVARYKRHPYAVGAALELIVDGLKIEKLPHDPRPVAIAEAQWKRICEKGDEAIESFEAYAILEVGVPEKIVEVVSGLSATTRKRLQKDSYLKGLLREEGEGKRIYHAILADYILEQIGEAEKKQYHSRAVEVYREKLTKAKKEQIRPDALAAMRLAEHVLAGEGKGAFVKTCAYETYGPLKMLGLLDVALGFSKRALDMVRKGSKEEAAIRCTMGLVYQTKGDLDQAEDMLNKSLEIEKKLGRLEGMADQYGNLGLIYQTKGDLKKAVEMYQKVLVIEKKLGRLDSIANAYGNLGLIYQTKGDLKKAKDMLEKSLEINKKLGRLEGMADQYGNLGLIYQTKGDLAKAVEMYQKVLVIGEKLGRLDSIATTYGNLGLIYQGIGDLDKAEEIQLKALEIDEKIGRLEGMAKRYSALGIVYRLRDRLDEAEKMHVKGLKIEKKIGSLEGIARQYGNLAVVYEQRGDIGKAREYWERALKLYKKIGVPHVVEAVEGVIEKLKDK